MGVESMSRMTSACVAVLLAVSAGVSGADDDANFRLTVLIEMNWEEGDMYRTYSGYADLYVHRSDGSDSAYVDYVEGYMHDHPGEQVPEFLGIVEGVGDLTVEGSGSSGDVYMTYEGSAEVTVIGDLVIHPEQGEILDVMLSGRTNEIWTAHTPDGDITMPQSAQITPIFLVFDEGGSEIERVEPWDEGTSREVFSLALMNDPFSAPEVYEEPLPGMD